MPGSSIQNRPPVKPPTGPRTRAVPARGVRRYEAAVLFCLLLVLGSGPGAVLCFGEDGHVALEPLAGAGGCACPPAGRADADAHRGPDLRPAAAAEACGACLDIPVSSGFRAVLYRMEPHPVADGASLPAVPAGSSLLRLPDRPELQGGGFPHLIDPGEARAALACTVLRI